MPTPTSRYHLTTILTLALLATGFSCNGFKAGEPAKPNWAVQKLFDEWPTTHEGMLAMLRTGVAMQSSADPNRIVVAQIAFNRDIPASEMIEWFKKFPSSSFVTWYTRAGKIGGGFYNFDPETPAKDELLPKLETEHRQEMVSSQEIIEELKKSCANNDPTCLPGTLEKAEAAYKADLSRPSYDVVGVALRGPTKDLAALQDDPRVYSVQIERGTYPQGIPFYRSIEEVSTWLP